MDRDEYVQNIAKKKDTICNSWTNYIGKSNIASMMVGYDHITGCGVTRVKRISLINCIVMVMLLVCIMVVVLVRMWDRYNLY